MNTEWPFPWTAAASSDIRSERATLSLGLLPAIRYFTDLVVPGLGRTWFVRQLSWGVAGLKLGSGSVGRRARTNVRCALGIEALACKLAWQSGLAPDRVIGSRAFGRDAHDAATWSFESLTQREHYVLNSYRAGVVRALTTQPVGAGRPPGLGLASGTRFSSMVLTPPGVELADTFLSQPAGRMILERRLLSWMDGEDLPAHSPGLVQALSPAGATKEEKRLVAGRLLHTDTEEARKRLALSRLLVEHRRPPAGRSLVKALRRARREDQSKELELALAFDAMLSRAQEVIGAITTVLEMRASATSTDLARRASVQAAIRALVFAAGAYRPHHKRASGGGHASAMRMAEAIEDKSASAIIEFLVLRDGQIVRLEDGGDIGRGPLFRRMNEGVAAGDDEASDPEGRSGLRTFGIANLHALAQDIGRRLIA